MNHNLPTWVTKAEAAKLVGRSPRTIERWVERRAIRARRVEGSLQLDPRDVLRAAEKSRHKSLPPYAPWKAPEPRPVYQGIKRCTRCDEVKSLNDFSPATRGDRKLTFRGKCRPCERVHRSCSKNSDANSYKLQGLANTRNEDSAAISPSVGHQPLSELPEETVMPEKTKLTLVEAHEYTDLAISTLRTYIREGKLPASRRGGRLIVIDVADLDALDEPLD